MNLLRGLQVFSCTAFIIMAIGCTPGPEKITQEFLTDLREQKYTDARRLVYPNLRDQVALIEQDKHALYNGQQWDYRNVVSKAAGDTAVVNYKVILNDCSQVEQRTVLARSGEQWLIRSIENTRISYSGQALKERTYANYGNQMLVAPLDIETISQGKLSGCIGRFIMVSGNICDFVVRGNTLTMSMGADSSQPLLYVKVVGDAKRRAMQDHDKFMKTDYMVESPLGDTFTAIGILHQLDGRFSMEVTNPQNIITGHVLRIEKP